MALKITLKPNERVILGAAVVRNGDSRAELIIENEVPLLRESDVLSPSQVHTPCERIVLCLQLAYVDPERREGHLEAFRVRVTEVRNAAPSLAPSLAGIEAEAEAGRFYQALRKTRALLDRERELLSNVR